jgi:hypothetical protein
MMNKNLINLKIPEDWKIGKIILLFKPHKSETEIKNYKLITLLKVIYKLFSSILADRLRNYLEINKAISPTQQGFIKGRDIKNHINTLIATLKHVKTQNKKIHILSTDIEKVFDYILFARIEEAANLFKIPEDFTNLILNSLERTLYININETKFKIFNTNRGTKQGDFLSPLIFNIFIEPLNQWLQNASGLEISTGKIKTKIKARAFCDNFIAIENSYQGIKKQFNKIKQYLNTFNLKLGISKCTYVTNQKNCNFILKSKHNKYLYDKEPNHTFRYLGITTSINLDTDNHWEPIKSKFKEIINKIIKSPTSILEKAFLANIAQTIFIFGAGILLTFTEHIVISKIYKHKCTKN